MERLTRDEHIERHKQLHRALDELMADFLTHTHRLPSEATIMELVQWSFRQTISPDEVDPMMETTGIATEDEFPTGMEIDV